MRLIRRLKTLGQRSIARDNRRRVLSPSQEHQSFANAWKSQEVPDQQWKLVASQLADLDRGVIIPEFQTFVRSLQHIMSEVGDISTIVELGCSSGYYGEVLRRFFPSKIYVGVDYSPAFVEFGRHKFPALDLRLGDTTCLEIADRQFDVVVSGSVLLHVYDWMLGLRESCRVARLGLVLHRTPASLGPTQLFTKTAYNQQMIEWTFNENELIEQVQAEGLVLRARWPVYENRKITRDPSSPEQFTYVFTRV